MVMAAVLACAAAADAQQISVRATPGVLVAGSAPGIQVIESAPIESLSMVKGAPFSADAVTEFTQVFGDGNRIERRYLSSLTRDSRGRTRREEEIALVGPFAATATGPLPRLITIVDPEARVSYTLDENLRIAHRNTIAAAKVIELVKMLEARQVGPGSASLITPGVGIGGGRGVIMTAPLATIETGKAVVALDGDAGAGTLKAEALGTRLVEGVKAEGTRTTSTIPAGAIGNLMPIEVVTERWFSPELQTAVLITRRDPRAGETVYRLTNIVRAEPNDSLFTVPPDYELREGKLGANLVKKVAPAPGAKAAPRNVTKAAPGK
jgi:hypothetical protein